MNSRYHKKVYFPKDSDKKLSALCDNLNDKNWQYSKHCLDNLKYRELNIEKLLLYVKSLILDYQNIFEYYEDKNKIIKICYRINYTAGQDLIFIISNTKELITIYLNMAEDNHITLKSNLYAKE